MYIYQFLSILDNDTLIAVQLEIMLLQGKYLEAKNLGQYVVETLGRQQLDLSIALSEAYLHLGDNYKADSTVFYLIHLGTSKKINSEGVKDLRSSKNSIAWLYLCLEKK